MSRRILTFANPADKFRQSEDPGSIILSRPKKKEYSVDLRRRKFLIQCCQGTAAAVVPAALRRAAFASHQSFASSSEVRSHAELYLHPQYRTRTSLDATLLKARAGLDQFVTEKYHDQIAAIIAQWNSSLLQSPRKLESISRVLAPDFAGCSLRPLESRLVRAGPVLEIRQNSFADRAYFGHDAFLQELRSLLEPFARMITSEFQITSINAGVDAATRDGRFSLLKTRVRYELVGSGSDFYREQRVGYWDLEWEASPTGEYCLRRWQTLDETRSRAAAPSFSDVTAAAFGRNSSYSAQVLHGSDYWRTVVDGACGVDIYGHNGISAGDIDGDGFDDLYICQPAGIPNLLYRNRGDGTFEDITESSGTGILENTACAIFADVNNDGRQDLVVVRTGGPLLFLNQGGCKFRAQPNAFRFASAPQGTFTGAAVADYDRDGWLDIYFCQYVYYQGTDQYKYPSPYFDAENGPPNFLMRNNRDGSFRDVTAESELDKNNTRYSFCCGWCDYNRDGWPDLYVVNDFGRKNLYHNNGDGTFTDLAPQAEVEDVGAGMSVCWFDYDNDGAEDLYVANMWSAAGERITAQEVFHRNAPEKQRALYRKHAMGNSLFHDGRAGNFRDSTAAAGVGMGRWSWSSDAWDFDHDGFPDLYITNGMVTGPSREDLNSFFWRQVIANSPAEPKPSYDYEQGWNAINELIRSDGTWSGFERNVFYANNRDGTFSDVSGAVGLDFLEDGRAFALADFDHDGRLEIFLKNRSGPQLRLLKNVINDLGPSIVFCLRGTNSNRDAIGAAVTVHSESNRQTRILRAGSGFLSQHSKEVFFGLGDGKDPVRASIRWPSGLVQELQELPLNHRVWVEEGLQPSHIEPFKRLSLPERQGGFAAPQEPESLPAIVETWLLAPISAPDFSLPDQAGQTRTLAAFHGHPVLLNFWTSASPDCELDLTTFKQLHEGRTARGVQLLMVNAGQRDARFRTLVRQLPFAVLHGSDDALGVYNILFRQLFDRHRDLPLPTSFLIDAKGEIVKVYQGPLNSEHVEQDIRQIPRNETERIAKALPFPGVSGGFEFRRNYLSLGSLFYQRGYFDQAKTSFRTALADDPSSAEALYGLGSVYLQQEKAGEAREAFERVVKLQPNYPDTLPNAWNNLGLLATREGRMPEAVQFFENVLKLNPDHLIALVNLGNAYRQQKQWDNARKVLKRALSVSPDNSEANYSLGMVFAELNDSQASYEHLQKALQVRPDYPEALNNLGVLYLRTGRRDQAVASFEACIRVAPSFDQSYLNLARVYALEENLGKARAVLKRLLIHRPGHLQARKMLQQMPP